MNLHSNMDDKTASIHYTQLVGVLGKSVVQKHGVDHWDIIEIITWAEFLRSYPKGTQFILIAEHP